MNAKLTSMLANNPIDSQPQRQTVDPTVAVQNRSLHMLSITQGRSEKIAITASAYYQNCGSTRSNQDKKAKYGV